VNHVLSEKAPRSSEDGKQAPPSGSQAPSPPLELKPLHEWSGRRLTAVALAWLVGAPLLAAPAIFGAVGWLARAERDRQLPETDTLAPGLRIDYAVAGPDTHVVVANAELLVILAVFTLPPVVLCLAWLAARRRRPAT
jgi:hypothetical protein